MFECVEVGAERNAPTPARPQQAAHAVVRTAVVVFIFSSLQGGGGVESIGVVVAAPKGVFGDTYGRVESSLTGCVRLVFRAVSYKWSLTLSCCGGKTQGLSVCGGGARRAGGMGAGSGRCEGSAHDETSVWVLLEQLPASARTPRSRFF